MFFICNTSFFVRVVSIEDGKKLANSWNAAFVESTAKNHGVS